MLCKYSVLRPRKQSISEEMNNDNELKFNLHSMTKLPGWLRHCVIYLVIIMVPACGRSVRVIMHRFDSNTRLEIHVLPSGFASDKFIANQDVFEVRETLCFTEHFFSHRANNAGDGRGAHASDKADANKDDVPLPPDRVMGQAANPNKDEIPERGSGRIKGGARVRERIIGYII